MLAGKIFAISLGIALMADGIGSVCKQPQQSFFWWQAVRIARATAGIALIAYGLLFA